MRDLIDAVATRITGTLGASWRVYPFAVPDRPAFPYVGIWSDPGLPRSRDFADSGQHRDVTLWVVTVTSSPKAAEASEQVLWAAARIHDALTRWRPQVGQLAWKPVALSTSPTTRDDDIPGHVIMHSTTQYGFSVHL